MSKERNPKAISSKDIQESARLVNQAISIARGGLKAFIEQHQTEMERHEKEFQANRSKIKENLRNGAKRTDGFII